MKRSIFVILISIIAYSCHEDQIPRKHFPQTWKIAGWRSYGFGGDSGFQSITDSTYFYVFKKDGTFTKTLGTQSTAGTYKLGTDKIYYDLIFPDGKLVDSCYGNTEKLTIGEKKMLVGGSAPCDGATLYFKLDK